VRVFAYVRWAKKFLNANGGGGCVGIAVAGGARRCVSRREGACDD